MGSLCRNWTRQKNPRNLHKKASENTILVWLDPCQSRNIFAAWPSLLKGFSIWNKILGKSSLHHCQVVRNSIQLIIVITMTTSPPWNTHEKPSGILCYYVKSWSITTFRPQQVFLNFGALRAESAKVTLVPGTTHSSGSDSHGHKFCFKKLHI